MITFHFVLFLGQRMSHDSIANIFIIWTELELAEKTYKMDNTIINILTTINGAVKFDSVTSCNLSYFHCRPIMNLNSIASTLAAAVMMQL